MLSPAMSYTQSVDSTFDIEKLSRKSFGRIDKNIQSLNDNIEKKTLKMLSRLQKQEGKLNMKLALKDSSAAKQLFASTKYQEFADHIKDPTNIKELKEYIPRLDSLKTGLAFLEKVKGINTKLPKEVTEKMDVLSKNVTDLKSKLQQASDIKKYINERKQQIREVFEKHDLTKHLKGINKEVYYYQQQLNEYKALIKDSKKLQDRALSELKKLPAFTEFMKKNSQLASLFRLPDNIGTSESLAGLQTRDAIQTQIQSRFAGSNVNPQQYIGQQMQAAQGELNKLKEKVNNLGGGSSDMEMPDFKPNSQKTKSFLKRIEYGANVQSQRPNGLLPVTSDIAVTAGYKLNDKSIIGIGVSYKMGWGSGWKDIHISHEGIGLRSFIDYKIKGGFSVSGGYEQNYNRSFTTIDQLQQFNAWQSSGLVGLTKKTKIGKKMNSVQLLWDFLSYRQVPRTPAILFRIGFGF
jgi:myosin heavy subunit